MTELTEQQARDLLTRAGNQAASEELYAAHRSDGGWAFAWAKGDRTPFGIRTVVVTDGGRIGRIELGETVTGAIIRLSAAAE
ncbi:hypothetical protein CGZ95_18660 [Enemella evansiae]|uniref:hypothetical protein n=1 Tax=Enemella evansiae TaxID=2016499 RepID=UPI000B967598|nr:hypothetical protein [Enemella evansiae]OYN93386.1 hypothetical protein CGZ95_18660 [Enemella evansiae]